MAKAEIVLGEMSGGGAKIATGSISSVTSPTQVNLDFTPTNVVLIWFHTSTTYDPIVAEYYDNTYYCSSRGYHNLNQGSITPNANGFTYSAGGNDWDNGHSYYIAWVE